jgi:hypothetical protein
VGFLGHGEIELVSALGFAWSIWLALFRSGYPVARHGIQIAVCYFDSGCFDFCVVLKKVPNGSQHRLCRAFADQKTNRQTNFFINVTERHLTPENPAFTCFVRTRTKRLIAPL